MAFDVIFGTTYFVTGLNRIQIIMKYECTLNMLIFINQNMHLDFPAVTKWECATNVGPFLFMINTAVAGKGFSSLFLLISVF